MAVNDYLFNYIKEKQITDPFSFSTPSRVLLDMFTTENNQTYLHYEYDNYFIRDKCTLIPLELYYKASIPTTDMIHNVLSDISVFKPIVNNYIMFYCPTKLPYGALDSFYVNELQDAYNRLDSIENYTLDDLKDTNFHYRSISSDLTLGIKLLSKYNSFNPICNKFNHNTNKDLLEISYALLNALIRYHDDYYTYNIDSLRNDRQNIKEVLECI